MEIYTIVCSEDSVSNPCTNTVDGSYMTRERAVEACVEKIMNRLETRCDVAYGAFHDANHEQLKDEILSVCDEDEANLYFCRDCKECELPEKVWDVVYRYIVDEVRSSGFYYIYVSTGDYEEFRFDIVKNNLEEN